MSSITNDKLLEEAAFYLEYFDSTILGKALQADLDANDMESLHYHLEEARKTAYQLEYNGGE